MPNDSSNSESLSVPIPVMPRKSSLKPPRQDGFPSIDLERLQAIADGTLEPSENGQKLTVHNPERRKSCVTFNERTEIRR